MGGKLQILFLNVQGLTNPKLLELQNMIDLNTILCMTETQQKIDRLNVKSDIDKVVCMRDLKSKKGGGL